MSSAIEAEMSGTRFDRTDHGLTIWNNNVTSLDGHESIKCIIYVIYLITDLG